jgi:hypothetical protein
VTSKQNLQWQLMAACCGIGFEILYSVFWAGFGHNVPPVAENMGAQDLAAWYQFHHSSILFGNSMAALVGVLYVPWTAQITVVMRRIEGGMPVLTVIQLIGGILNAWILSFCPAIWATAAFRPETDPNIVRALNDLAFFLFDLTYAGASLQAIALGIVGLADKSREPVFKPWVCYWSIFTGLSFLPITVMPFDQTGPFAWNGFLTFWFAFTTFFVWSASVGWSMASDARRRLRAEEGTAIPGGAAAARG